MSNKANARRKKHAEKVEKQGKNVVMWIMVGLIVLALIWTLTSVYAVN